MTTVFLSGSRRLSRINEDVRRRVANMVGQGFKLIVGDANGADKALQAFLSAQEYTNVLVYCSGPTCRNNVGGWPTINIDVDPKLKGREFYVQKDREMSRAADFGFVVWDGESLGAISNVVDLVLSNKTSVVYLSPAKAFVNVKSAKDAIQLIDLGGGDQDDKDIQKLRKMLDKGLAEYASQTVLPF